MVFCFYLYQMMDVHLAFLVISSGSISNHDSVYLKLIQSCVSNIHSYTHIYVCVYINIHRRCWVGKILWRKAWQPTPVFLPGKSRRQRSNTWDCKRVRHDLENKQHSYTSNVSG